MLGEYDGSGNLIEETVWLEDLPVAVMQPNGTGGVNVFYIHSDHVQTPKAITRPADNAFVWRWDQDPYGTTSPNQNPSGLGAFVFNQRFPGQYYDSETGLNYNMARDYDPAVGRYVESDPIGLKGGINTYAYGNGNPLSNSDPSGLAPSGSLILHLLRQWGSNRGGPSCSNNDDERDRCRQVKADAIQHCADTTLPTRDYGVSFQRCVNKNIEDQGCGPGGTPLPQSTPVIPAPPPARDPNSSQNTTATSTLFLSLLGLLGALAVP